MLVQYVLLPCLPLCHRSEFYQNGYYTNVRVHCGVTYSCKFWSRNHIFGMNEARLLLTNSAE